MSGVLNRFESQIKDRVAREMRAAATEIKRYDFKARVEELIREETRRWSYNSRDQMKRFTQQFERQLAEAADDEAVQERVRVQIDQAIDVALDEDRIRALAEDWVDEWIEETVREQLEARLNERVAIMLDDLLAPIQEEE